MVLSLKDMVCEKRLKVIMVLFGDLRRRNDGAFYNSHGYQFSRGFKLQHSGIILCLH
jgi:hypothetical protein